MKLTKKHIFTLIIIPFLVGMLVNFVSDALKNHPFAESGLSFEFNLLIKFKTK